MPTNIFFDFDKTLVNKHVNNNLNVFFNRSALDEAVKFIDEQREDPKAIIPDRLDEIVNKYIDDNKNFFPKESYLRNFLLELKKRDDVNLYVISASLYPSINRKILNHMGIENCFTDIVSVDQQDIDKIPELKYNKMVELAGGQDAFNSTRNIFIDDGESNVSYFREKAEELKLSNCIGIHAVIKVKEGIKHSEDNGKEDYVSEAYNERKKHKGCWADGRIMIDVLKELDNPLLKNETSPENKAISREDTVIYEDPRDWIGKNPSSEINPEKSLEGKGAPKNEAISREESVYLEDPRDWTRGKYPAETNLEKSLEGQGAPEEDNSNPSLYAKYKIKGRAEGKFKPIEVHPSNNNTDMSKLTIPSNKKEQELSKATPKTPPKVAPKPKTPPKVATKPKTPPKVDTKPVVGRKI